MILRTLFTLFVGFVSTIECLGNMEYNILINNNTEKIIVLTLIDKIDSFSLSKNNECYRFNKKTLDIPPLTSILLLSEFSTKTKELFMINEDRCSLTKNNEYELYAYPEISGNTIQFIADWHGNDYIINVGNKIQNTNMINIDEMVKIKQKTYDFGEDLFGF